MTSASRLPTGFPDDELLLRYFAGTCTIAEREAINSASQLDSAYAERLEEMQLVWQYAVRAAIPGNLETALAEFRRRRAALPMHRRGVRGDTPSSGRSIVWPATVAIGIVALAFLALRPANRRLGSHTAEPALVYTTGNGQRANITLPDSNTVSLDVASRLEVPTDYARGNHLLRLRGEALFTVVHHEQIPISVVAGNTVARVLGTSFIVRKYPEEAVTTIAVREGRVGVRAVVISSGQQLIVTPGGATRLLPATPAQFSFATGVLTLDGMSLRNAIPQLNRWYDADIRLADSTLATQRIGGNFTAGSLTDLQRVLELTFNVRVTRDGRVLTLYPRRS